MFPLGGDKISPPRDIVSIREFREKESRRLSRFIEKSGPFVDYYQGGKTDHDLDYFLPANYERARTIFSKPYETD